MMHPLVSVILPTWNRAKYLPQAMDSVLSQDYKNLELVVVDDGSTDGTSELVSSYKDDRVCYIKTAANRGAAAARNMGIRCASGEFLAFQSSNGVWKQDKIRKQIEKFADVSMDTVMVYHLLARKTGEGKNQEIPDRSVIWGERQGRIYDQLLRRDFIGLPSICIRRSALLGVDGIGVFDENIPDLHDYDLILRIARRYRIDYIDEMLAETFYLEEGRNHDMFSLITSNCMILGKYKEDMRRLGLYEGRIKYLQDLGRMTHTRRRMEELIRKYCG